MGQFLTFTSQTLGGDKDVKVLRYILSALRDSDWQYSVSDKIRKLDKESNHITIAGIIRLFLTEYIEVDNLQSLSRYVKKDDKLCIDQMMNADDYNGLSEDETRITMSNDIFNHLKEVLLKYKSHFLDFDAIAFISLLEARFEEIKRKEYISKRSKS